VSFSRRLRSERRGPSCKMRLVTVMLGHLRTSATRRWAHAARTLRALGRKTPASRPFRANLPAYCRAISGLRE
jgi:hypothetical protein